MKKFVPLFEEFNQNEALHEIVKQIADALEETGRYDFVQAVGDTINTTDETEVSWEEFRYNGESHRVKVTHTVILKFIANEDSEELLRLADMGLANITAALSTEIASSLVWDSRDCSFEHTVGDLSEFTEMTMEDLGIAEENTMAEIAENLTEWIIEDGHGLAYGVKLPELWDQWVDEQESGDDEEWEEEEEEIDESQRHDEPFVKWACEQLNIKTCPKIEFGDDHSFAIQNRSMAYFHPGEYRIYVLRGSRTKADWLRSLAHELVHAAQFERGEDLDGSTGSPHENEANSMAGQLLRDYGKIDSTIYEG